jgi:UDP-N-acetylglucosamine--N-acetylmuramyl-(pentapeptide) pyrophosphoryl-undecaprenol N-acetylglucosamine transferase
MAQQGAALHMEQADMTPQALADALSGLNRERLLDMARSARACARPEATVRVADEIELLVKAA